MRDLRNNLSAAQSLAPQARTASANGATVDLLGFGGAVVLASIGAWTDGSHALKLQESDDGSTWTDVAADDQQGAFTAIAGSGGADAVQEVGYLGAKRYIRVISTVTGATAGAVYGAMVVRGHPALAPAA